MPADGWKTFDPAELGGAATYHLVNAMVVPRPIAWVSTLSEAGVPNIAPHSYFTVASPRPPIVCFSSGGEKDTLRNLRHTDDFVINIVSEELAEPMNITAADFPPAESEFAATGLTPAPSERVQSPRLLESPVSFECTVERELEIGDAPNTLVFGEIVYVHVAEHVLVDGRIDVSKVRPVGRLSGAGYVWSREFFDMPRISYDQWKADGAARKGGPA